METETIASRNIVDLLLYEEFGLGTCGSLISGSGADVDENATHIPERSGFVLGWDCWGNMNFYLYHEVLNLARFRKFGL